METFGTATFKEGVHFPEEISPSPETAGHPVTDVAGEAEGLMFSRSQTLFVEGPQTRVRFLQMRSSQGRMLARSWMESKRESGVEFRFCGD